MNCGLGGAGKIDMSPAIGGTGDMASNLAGKALAVGRAGGNIESIVYTVFEMITPRQSVVLFWTLALKCQ